MISCGCNYDGPDNPGDQWFYSPDKFSIFDKPRRKRCLSCKRLINRGEPCLEFDRKRLPWSDIEERILGDEITMPPVYMCEQCGEIYFNLEDIGYCVLVGNMQEALEEYHDITGFKKEAR